MTPEEKEKSKKIHFTFGSFLPTGQHRSTGRFRSFYPSLYDVKLFGKICATIYYHNDNQTYSIHLKIQKTSESFDWVILNYDFNSLNEAKKFLNRNKNKIVDTFDLYLQ